ncbi:MAG: hypothetical protein D6712_06945 [Chloroflexi bacterium]|nr:MAG: hypothetical protein D6712_06945 [Chloroflexota bacterium]
MKKWLRYGALLLLLIIVTGCRQQASPADVQNIDIAISFVPAELAVGEAELTVTLTDSEGNFITDAQVEVRGDMTHAGMVPVIVTAESGDDSYHAAFEWTMGGDWIVTVTATLPDGSVVEKTFNYSVSGDMNMDMSEDTGESHNMSEMTPEATVDN